MAKVRPFGKGNDWENVAVRGFITVFTKQKVLQMVQIQFVPAALKTSEAYFIKVYLCCKYLSERWNVIESNEGCSKYIT